MPQAQHTLAIGTLLRERYTIEKILGVGNAGAVYLVKDLQQRPLQPHPFILKEINGLDQQARHQFAFRGIDLQQLHHPALPPIHHVFNDAKRQRVYLVAEYVEGTSMETLRQQMPEGRFSWAELRPLIEPVVDALAYLHEQGPPLVHGDLKPTNIIKDSQGAVLLVDMGSAQAASPERLRQALPGDLAMYQAPEAFDGPPGTTSDIYSLGATLYALLTGQAPTDAPTRQSQVRDQQPDPLPLASQVIADLPRPLAQVLQQGLALEPDKRFASVKAFWEALLAPPTQEETSAPADLPPAADAPATSSMQEDASTPILAIPAGDEHSTPTLAIPTEDVRSALPAGGTQARRSRSKKPLLRVALLCALALVLTSAGAWAWIANSNHITLPTTARQGSPSTSLTPGQPQQPTSQATLPVSPTPPVSYPSLSGTYNGNLQPTFPPPRAGRTIPFTLHIQHQESQRISGSFTASSFKSDRFTGDLFTGLVSPSGQVQFTVLDASGSAILAFTGRLTKVSSSSAPPGGRFHSCAAENGAICLTSDGPLSGSWTVQQKV